ncbi:hypothetical protein Bca52824_066457 [Brassica carinata]|uniref:Uncharacterized protein n=1 Tax=Brassica carinata TaxID=52824 RepID=A0A8X7QLW8_BRACI|nr:hypothetical protein Bca52824_066457 [Brassica carinata]
MATTSPRVSIEDSDGSRGSENNGGEEVLRKEGSEISPEILKENRGVVKVWSADDGGPNVGGRTTSEAEASMSLSEYRIVNDKEELIPRKMSLALEAEKEKNSYAEEEDEDRVHDPSLRKDQEGAVGARLGTAQASTMQLPGHKTRGKGRRGKQPTNAMRSETCVKERTCHLPPTLEWRLDETPPSSRVKPMKNSSRRNHLHGGTSTPDLCFPKNESSTI